MVLALNGNRNPFLDFIFLNATQLGDALILLFLLPLVLLFRFKWLYTFLLAFLFQVFFVMLFKKGILAGELRPYLYYKYSNQLHLLDLVPGLKMRHIHTFPSGHAATIFFVSTYFAILSRNLLVSWSLALIALMVGLSRVYLAQHFFPDVYFGMLFGVLSVILSHEITKRYPISGNNKKLFEDVIQFDKVKLIFFRAFR